ncbi:LANO_0B01970g1_1 [Lachancea nothofagi CBS 11611]|uniref:Histone acetyltransferase type B catalytic subunit n=1 Tax=Lachancea nothofagi CBS 11611 TaxID=1266666 RepID=A0A1G4IW78_9SACH|nr:LANO_0B01970g1_1 [Lachancea nothofagi CBS 11611]
MEAASQMKPEAWTVSSNEALKLSLVDDDGAVQFSPTFTYPIYGDSEQIFGYQDLQIFLVFDSVTFKPFTNVKYGAKLMDTVDDVQTKLLNYLPKDDVIIRDEMKWVDTFSKEREEFELPDDRFKVKSYNVDENNYTIYKVKLQEAAIKALHRRMQIFTLLFIESASYIDEDDEGWEIFLTFNAKTKQCVGYSTTYQYWKYTGGPNFDNNENSFTTGKISQFMVFPPYQGNGHGSYLYNAIVDVYQSDPQVLEITVEDPNESFDSLRDRNDYLRLKNSGIAAAIPDELPISEEWIEKEKGNCKIEKRQFMRLIEINLLSKSSPNFRLQVKKRLYEKNFDLLSDLDAATRNDKLQTAFLLVKEEYEAMLSSISSRKRTLSNNSGSSSKKIKLNNN